MVVTLLDVNVVTFLVLVSIFTILGIPLLAQYKYPEASKAKPCGRLSDTSRNILEVKPPGGISIILLHASYETYKLPCLSFTKP
jgi:hypothetical protein